MLISCNAAPTYQEINKDAKDPDDQESMKPKRAAC